MVVRVEATTRRKIGGHRRAATAIRPDFIFSKKRVAVFVDGCFWHGCPKHSKPARWLRKSSMGDDLPSPKLPPSLKLRRTRRRTGRAFWREKMAANVARDRLVNRELRKLGWRVIRIWEHELSKSSERCVERIRRELG